MAFTINNVSGSSQGPFGLVTQTTILAAGTYVVTDALLTDFLLDNTLGVGIRQENLTITAGSVTMTDGTASQYLNQIMSGLVLIKGQTTMDNSASIAIASNQTSIPVASTLTAETTKVIGTINIAAAQTLATVTTVSAVTAITNALPAGTNAIGTVGITTLSTSSVTSVNGNSGNVQLLASTAGRKLAMFYNESTAILYLKLGTTASITSYTVQIPPSGYYELPLPCYTGEIDGIWASSTGAVRITELT